MTAAQNERGHDQSDIDREYAKARAQNEPAFRWEPPMWCPEYGQVNSFAVSSEGNIIVTFIDGTNLFYAKNGLALSLEHRNEYRLRNGIMPGKEVADDLSELQACIAVATKALDRLFMTKVPASAYVQPEPVERTCWLNIYSEQTVCAWPTKEEADKYESNRIACKQITFHEGEGL